LKAKTKLKIALETAVPIWQDEFRRRGGVQKDDIARAKQSVAEFSENGDALFYKKVSKTTELFNKVAEAIAVLSLLPGGVDVFEKHWNG